MPNFGDCAKADNLTEITWDHAVNSWAELNRALQSKSHFFRVIISKFEQILFVMQLKLKKNIGKFACAN